MKLRKIGWLVSLVIIMLASCSDKDDVILDNENVQTLTVNGVDREYIIYIPTAYDSSNAVPLLFNFHGYTQSASIQMSEGDMSSIADTANFILVYPQGALLDGATHWNVGAWTTGSTSDDVGFINALIDELDNNYNIDLNRIYSVGFSNGGSFSFELACQLSDRIAAIGSVGGAMTDYTQNACNAQHPTPVITIHGTNDNIVDYNGSYPDAIMSQDAMLTYWSNFNNTSAMSIMDLPNTNTSYQSTVMYYEYTNGNNCSAVQHYEINGGGHEWFGNEGNMDINASEVLWNFVSRYNINGLIGC